MSIMTQAVAGRTLGMPPLVAWLIENVLRGRFRTQGLINTPLKQMKILETLTLGPRKQLVLVSCGQERFLIGTGPESVQTIVRITAECTAPATMTSMDKGAQS